MEYDIINVKEYKDKILPTAVEFIVTPYASMETNLCGKVIVVSDKVSNITEVKIKKNSKKSIAYILPLQDNANNTIYINRKYIGSITGIDAPYFGVYTLRPEKFLFNIDI